MKTLNKQSIAAIILSGGRGTRLGGVDKGLQKYNGKALIQWVIDAIQPQVSQIIISINRNEKDYRTFGLPLVPDFQQDTYDGPIAGILSCAIALKNKGLSNYLDYLLIATCDSPNLQVDYIERLYQAIESTEFDLAVVHDGERRQNLHCLIKNKAIPSLQDYFDHGGRSMIGWFEICKIIEVNFLDQANSFTNINSHVGLR